MGTPAMARLAVTSVLKMATATMAAPQLEGLKGLLSTLSGDDQPGEVNGDYEQVPYTTIQKFNGYEERKYPSVKWVCTQGTYPVEEVAEEDGEEGNFLQKIMEMMSKKNWKNKPSSEMFMRLFRYISGVNEQREKVEMTVPVLSEKTPNADITMMTTQMCFYLDKAHQANPPQPEEEEVKIVETKPMTVFVHIFGGYAMKDSVWIREAANFEEKLKSDGRNDEIEWSSYFTAGYDSPMKFWNRRNEVMFLKKPTVVWFLFKIVK